VSYREHADGTIESVNFDAHPSRGAPLSGGGAGTPLRNREVLGANRTNSRIARAELLRGNELNRRGLSRLRDGLERRRHCALRVSNDRPGWKGRRQ